MVAPAKTPATATTKESRDNLFICASLLGPQGALIGFGYGAEALVQESLNALAAVRLGCVDVAFRITRDAVHRVELSRLSAAVAEAGENFQRVALHDVDLFVSAVDQIKELLLGILRERYIPNGAVAQRSLLDEDFLHERSILLEHLNPVIHAIAHIHETVVREFGAVNGIAELLRRRRIRIVRAEVRV